MQWLEQDTKEVKGAAYIIVVKQRRCGTCNSPRYVPGTASARPRVSFYNVPIEEDFHSAASFSSFLRASAQPDDFVSVKVDIDYVQAELPIVMGIARRPELTALVDELFFEYHFNFDELDFGWRSQTGARNHVNDTVDDALSLMSELRRAGVRSHFWI